MNGRPSHPTDLFLGQTLAFQQGSRSGWATRLVQTPVARDL